MRRGLWFAAGAGAGVYAMVRGRRAAEAFTADGLHDRWQALGLGARLFRDEVATGKAEAEARLRERLAPDDPQRQLAAAQHDAVPHEAAQHDASAPLAAIDTPHGRTPGPEEGPQ